MSTRAQSALASITREIQRRESLLNQSDDVVSVTITVKFSTGMPTVRGIVYHEERLTHREKAG